MKKTISWMVSNSLCVGCGVCAGICPAGAISITTRNGQYRPEVSQEKCISNKGCSTCLDVCPGHEVQINKMACDLFSSQDTLYDSNIGRYLNCYSGYSTNDDIRYHSASGGLVSQFLIYLLEKEIVDGAVVTAFDRERPFLASTRIARNADDVLLAKSSKYSPVEMSQAVQALRKETGKFVVVGLPCHIHAFRKLADKNSGFKKKIIGFFSLYCSEGRTFSMTEYIFRERGIDRNELAYFAYRDFGCLGSMAVQFNSGTLYQEPYQKYYHPLRSFFIPRRCISCIDHYGELSDVSFGDIHYGEFKKDKIGISSLVVRNAYFNQLLLDACHDNFIRLSELSPDILNKSQAMLAHKKGRNVTAIKMDKMRGRPTPCYDISIQDRHKIKSIVSYLHTIIQMFIGRHKTLWFIIKFLKRKPQIR